MAHVLHMPEIAANAVEATLATWLIAEGSDFTTGQSLAVVETDKAAVDLEAESDGVLLRILIPDGSNVEVGTPIALLGDANDKGIDIHATLAEFGLNAQAPAVLTNEEPDTHQSSVAPRVASPRPPEDSERIFASPLARKMALDAGISLGEIPGTGPGHRIVRKDVQAAMANRSRLGDVQLDTASKLQFTDIPHSRMRKTIAIRLTQSKQTAPHFYLRGTCRVEALLRARASLNELSSTKISINDLLIKAIAKAHTLVPEMNVIWMDEATRQYSTVDISVAIATKTGLFTPVLKGVDSANVTAIARQVADYVTRAREGRLQPTELEGGSITITNLGMFGVEEFTAILNPPQSAILAIGAVTQEAIVQDGVVKVAPIVRVVISVDHRSIDGTTAARWLQKFVAVVENPILLFS